MSTYVPKKDPVHNATRSLLTRVRKEASGLAPSMWARLPRKLAPRSIATSPRSMGVHVPHTIARIVVGTERRNRKPNFRATKIGGKNPNLKEYSFAQLSKKMDRLKKAIKKQGAEWKKPCCSDGDSALE